MKHAADRPHIQNQALDGRTGFEALIGHALDQLRDLEARAYELEHEVAKRELDAALLTEAAERRGLQVLRLTQQMEIIRRRSSTLVAPALDSGRPALASSGERDALRLGRRSSPPAVGFFQNMSSPLTALDRAVTNDKLLTKRILAQAGIPLARGEVVRSIDGALAAFHRIEPPVVVKPITGSHGRGVTVNIRDEDELKTAAREAFERTSRLLVEEMVTSIDLRVMTVAGRAVAAMLRVPANVVGDGTLSIRELIEQKNAMRASNAYLRHCPIEVNPFTEHHLKLRGLTPDSVPDAGRRVFLHYKANLSSGGDSYEIIDAVHPEILRLAERAAACFGSAYHAGVDILLERFDVAPEEQRCIVCELNLNNEMPIHVFPLFGTPSATGDETIEGYFFRAQAQLEQDRYRLDPAGRLESAAAETGGEHAAPSDDRPGRGSSPEPIERLATLAGAVTTPVPPEDHRTAMQLDQRHLGQALQRTGFDDVQFRGRRLIHARRGGHEVLLHRSGRTVFVGALAGRPLGLRKLLRSAGLPALHQAQFAPEDLAGAQSLVSTLRGRWQARPRPNEDRLSFQVVTAERLERIWSRFPAETTTVVLDQMPTGPALSVLMVNGEPVASVLLSPPSVAGDGTTPLGVLIARKRAARAAHPYLRHLPVKEALTSDDGLARRGLRRDQVLAEAELAYLSHSPIDSHGPDTVGIDGCPVPEVAELSSAVLELIGRIPVASITFARQAGNAGPGGSWVVWTFDPDPLIGRFAFPWAGDASPPYDQVAAALTSGPRYVLPVS